MCVTARVREIGLIVHSSCSWIELLIVHSKCSWNECHVFIPIVLRGIVTPTSRTAKNIKRAHLYPKDISNHLLNIS